MKSVSPLLVAALIGVGVASVNGPVVAHHAFAAEFDSNKPVELKGVVTRLQWANPHSWLHVDVKEPDGRVTSWGIEFGAPYSLLQRGLRKTISPWAPRSW